MAFLVFESLRHIVYRAGHKFPHQFGYANKIQFLFQLLIFFISLTSFLHSTKEWKELEIIQSLCFIYPHWNKCSKTNSSILPLLFSKETSGYKGKGISGYPGLILVLGCAQAGIFWIQLAQYHAWAFCQHLLLKLMNRLVFFSSQGPCTPTAPHHHHHILASLQ